MKIDLFMPCLMDQFYPQTGLNMVKVLEHLGCKVHYNTEQTCCGLPAFTAGHWEEAREVGEKLLNEVSNDKNLVCGAGACTAMIRNSFDLLFHNSSYHNKYRQLQKKTFEFSEFLVDVLKVQSLDSVFEGKVAFLDACQALNHCEIKSQPRFLLNLVSKLEMVSYNQSEECCGFGGIFSVKFESLSLKMAENKVNQIVEAGADTIVSTDTGCLMHLEAYIKKNKIPLKTMHLADVLASGL